MGLHNTDTLNWDTVFALPISEVNKTIVSQKASPKKFGCHTTRGSIAGVFEEWQIIKGGDGSLIHLSIPVNNVTGIYEEDSFSWKRFRMIVEVALNFLPQELPAVSSNVYQLKLKTTSNNPDKPIVSILSIQKEKDLNGNIIKPTGALVDNEAEEAEVYIKHFMLQWLKNNLKEFNHVFATVNLNKYISHDSQWAWCKPSYVDYAYLDSDDEAKKASLLGILCMTGGRPVTEQQLRQIDPFVIPEKSIAGFLISEKRILNDLVLPTLPLKWKNSSVNDYEVVNSRSADSGQYQYVLQLKQGKRIELDKVKDKLGVSHTPYMTKLKIILEADQVIVETHAETDVGMGITSHCSATHWYAITLGEKQNGKQTLIFKKAKEPIINQNTEQSNATKIEEAIIVIIGVIVTAILTVFTSGVVFVVGAIIIGLLTGAAALLPQVIENLNTATSPDIDLMVYNATSPIKWAGSDVFKLDYAALAGPLQLGGTPNFH
ncbi:TULIP family P47-like protein [Bacillus sp. 2SH]|uniref:TULIP family P47-like protein n=1 Tax=Bacillus sp. 2SH TaxID=2502202 RepID=UPI0010F7C43A|nr:TULIP family P47-like protein [Bacillus sp. 2SH]